MSAPGFEPFSRTLEAKEGETLVLEVALAKVGAAPVAPPPPPPAERPLPVWPFVTGGVALAMIGTGVAFRFVGFAAEDALDEGCGEDRLCDPRGSYDPSDDNQQKNFAFGMFVGLTVGGERPRWRPWWGSWSSSRSRILRTPPSGSCHTRSRRAPCWR